MNPLRYGCLLLIVMIVKYIFWALVITCFVLLFKEIEKSVKNKNKMI